MLKKRSRSKQASLMADTNQKQSKPTPFPRLFTAFSSFKSFTENDAVASPTSILDTKPFTVLKNPFGSDNPKPYEPETRLKLEPKRIGLAIVDSLVQEENQEPGFSRPRSGTIIFGSQLRIRVPDPPRSSSDFGIKTKNPPVSPSPEEMKKTVSGSGLASPRIFTGYFSTSDMELSEDYTCVTCHGPNPRTIHIFDNCIIESQPGVVLFRSSDPVNESDCLPSDSFLSTCCNCKKDLGPRDDIFMYSGDLRPGKSWIQVPLADVALEGLRARYGHFQLRWSLVGFKWGDHQPSWRPRRAPRLSSGGRSLTRSSETRFIKKKKLTNLW